MLLARREHSRQELRFKLAQRDFPAELVEEVLLHCEQQNYLNHQRFCEMFIRTRYNQGYGKLRIVNELRQKGIKGEEMTPAFAEVEHEFEVDWFESALGCYLKRFGAGAFAPGKERAKRMRYMQYRGFTTDQIQYALEAAPAAD